MKNTLIIIATAIAFLALGGGIIAWSVHQRPEAPEEETLKLRYFTDENFADEVVANSMNKPVLVDFYADWCFPCRMLEPSIIHMAETFGDSAIVGKIDTDKNMIGRKLGIKRIPTVLIIRNGEITHSFQGVVPKEDLIAALEDQGGVRVD
jgi:thioredoxin 1